MGISVPNLEIKYLLRMNSLLTEFKQVNVFLPLEIIIFDIFYLKRLNFYLKFKIKRFETRNLLKRACF